WPPRSARAARSLGRQHSVYGCDRSRERPLVRPHLRVQGPRAAVAPPAPTAVVPTPTPSATQMKYVAGANDGSANPDQCRNDSAPSPNTDGCNSNANQWVNGNLGESKSFYLEGDSIPYRLTFDKTRHRGHTHGYRVGHAGGMPERQARRVVNAVTLHRMVSV